MGSDNKPGDLFGTSNGILSYLPRLFVIATLTAGFFYFIRDGSDLQNLDALQPTSARNQARMVKIKVFNDIPHPVSLYFEDEETVSGSYLEDLSYGKSAEILATPGDVLFATLVHGVTKLSSFRVKARKTEYKLQARDPALFEAAISETSRHTKPEPGADPIDDRPEHTPEAKAHVNKRDIENAPESFGGPEPSERSGPGRVTYVDFGVRTEERIPEGVSNRVPMISAMPARFRSLYPHDLDMWYDNGADGVWTGRIRFGKETATTTYDGHEFYFTLHDESTGRTGKKGKEVMRYKMSRTQSFYILEDRDMNHPKAPTAEQQKVIDETYKEVAYMEAYYERTGELYYASCRDADGKFRPRPRPIHYMWPADHIGQVHSVQTVEGYVRCSGPAARCQDATGPKLELEVLSNKPRAFVIKDFLSDFEAQEVINESRSHLTRSSVGEGENSGGSETRTSENTWLSREKSDVTRALFKRAADLLQIDEKLISNGGNGIAEQMQVVHYQDGQRYDPHYDWGATRHADRYITLLLYLTDMAGPDAGGQTSFPRGQGRDGKSFKIHPGARSAVLFYNLLPDGNTDDASLHSATSVTKGEKFLANFWVWDPKRL